MSRYLSKEQWLQAEERFVYGDSITHAELAALIGVSDTTVSKHASPKDGNWLYKRNVAQKELRLDAKARLIKDNQELNLVREQSFEDRFEQSSSKMNDLLDLLLDYFVPSPDASHEQIKACKEQLDLLSSNQKATLVVRCVERLSGVAKTKQLLSGGETERLLIDLRGGADVSLDAQTEALIEEVLQKARDSRASSDASEWESAR